MIRPKIVIEDRLTDDQRRTLREKCLAVEASTLSAIEKANEISYLRTEAQKEV